MFPVATGMPNYSPTGTNRFIPEIWSGKLVVKFYDACVLADISNTDYEGDIKKHGDTVIIRTIPNMTIRTYKKGQVLQTERPESPSLSLLIDKVQYFGIVIDDVDRYQSDIPLMDKWAEDASEQMKIVVDTEVLGAVYADVAAANKGATAG